MRTAYLCRMKKCAFFLFMMLLAACSNNDGISTDANGNTTFTYEPINWTMQLPKDWYILNAAERDKLDYAAENYYEEAAAGKKRSGVKKIVMGVRKGESNMNACYAYIRSYARDEDNPGLRELLRQQKKQYDTPPYTVYDTLQHINIGGIEYEKATLTVAYNNKPHFTYITYSGMVDTLNFGVSIVTNNKTDEKMLDNYFRQSATGINPVAH